MPEYRVYSIDPAGHFIDVQEMYCASDAAAVVRAKQLMRGHPVEVWHRGRLIQKIPRAGALVEVGGEREPTDKR